MSHDPCDRPSAESAKRGATRRAQPSQSLVDKYRSPTSLLPDDAYLDIPGRDPSVK